MPKNINKLKIIAATSMTIFSLACVFVATIAWFSANRAVNGNGNGFEIGNEGGIIESVKLHELEKIATGGAQTSYSFNKEPSVTYTAKSGGFTKEPSDYTSTSIGTYDSLVDQVYAVLYVIQLKEEAVKDRSPVTLQITTSTEEKDNLFHTNDGTYANLLNKEGNPMSSIVQFYSMPVMKSIQYSFVGTTEPSFNSFYSGTNYQQTISTELSVAGTSPMTCLEVIVAYNKDNIEKLLEINETNEKIWSLDYNNTIGFKQDWRISVI